MRFSGFCHKRGFFDRTACIIDPAWNVQRIGAEIMIVDQLPFAVPLGAGFLNAPISSFLL